MLRLPTGIFYAQGVKANVLLLGCQAAASSAATEGLWVLRLPKPTSTSRSRLGRSRSLRTLDGFVAASTSPAIATSGDER